MPWSKRERQNDTSQCHVASPKLTRTAEGSNSSARELLHYEISSIRQTVRSHEVRGSLVKHSQTKGIQAQFPFSRAACFFTRRCFVRIRLLLGLSSERILRLHRLKSMATTKIEPVILSCHENSGQSSQTVRGKVPSQRPHR
jgi:hypothetical protein